MSSTCHLGEALQQALESDQCLVDFTCHGEVDKFSGLPRISIGEAFPDTPSNPPYIGWDLLSTRSITEDDPTLGHYTTNVLFWAIDDTSSGANKIADAIHCFFTRRPADYTGFKRWFRDISNDCIRNTCTTFQDRAFGQRTNTFFNDDRDMWAAVVEVRFQWSDCPCTGVYCDPVEIERCEEQELPNSNCNDCQLDNFEG